MKGVVKFYLDTKNYGFIARDDGGPDVFFHETDMAAADIEGLKKGDRVGFEVIDAGKGPKVTHLVKAPADGG